MGTKNHVFDVSRDHPMKMDNFRVVWPIEGIGVSTVVYAAKWIIQSLIIRLTAADFNAADWSMSHYVVSR